MQLREQCGVKVSSMRVAVTVGAMVSWVLACTGGSGHATRSVSGPLPSAANSRIVSAFTIQGRVTDAGGGALAHATVTLEGAVPMTRRAVTDRRGYYRFDDVVSGFVVGPHPWIGAQTTDRRASPSVTVPLADAIVDLVVLPVGAIVGTVTGAPERVERVIASLVGIPESVHSAPIDRVGRFHLDGMAVGDYVVYARLERGSTSDQRVSVIAGEQAMVTLMSPILPVDIQVHVFGLNCTTVELRSGGRPLGSESCMGHEVTFHSVMPGSYSVCADTTCEPIEVKSSARWFEIGAP